MAQMQLVERQDRQAVTLLERMAKSAARPQSQLQALCTLDGLGALSGQSFLIALDSRSPELRTALTRLFESHLDEHPELATTMLVIRDEIELATVMQAAASVGESTRPAHGKTLMMLALLFQGEPLIVAAALSSLDGPKTDVAIARFNEGNWPRGTPSHDTAGSLIDTAIGFERWDAAADLVMFIATPVNETYHAWQLESLAHARRKLGEPMQPYDPRLDVHNETSELHKRIEAAARFARGQVINEKADWRTLTASVNLVATGKMTAADEALFAGLLTPHVDASRQSAVVSALAGTNRPQVAEILLRGWKGHSPGLRSQILDALLSRGGWTNSLLSSIEAHQIAAADIDAARRQRLLKSNNATIRQRASKLFAGDAKRDRAKLIEQYESAIAGASAANLDAGKTVFKERCSACHKLEDVGAEVGPDLKGLTDKSPKHLLTSILDPNRAVEPKYVSYTAVTLQGRIYNGMLADEAGGSLTLLDGEGKRHVILRSDLDELAASGKSLMPEGLEKDVSPAQMRDLLSYLQDALNPSTE